MMLLPDKPWYRSLTVWGVLTGTVGFLSHPAVFDRLPQQVAAAVGVAGAALATLGLRRATPNSAGVGDVGDPLPEASNRWEITFGEDGFNPYGETRDDVIRRRQLMDATAADNRGALMGPHYTPPRE